MSLTITSIEDSLVRSCIAGDASAWRALHRRYYPVAGAFLRKLGMRDSDLDSACQEIFAELFRYLPTFRGQTDLKTWLYRLCSTEAQRMRRPSRLVRVLWGRLQSEGLLRRSGHPKPTWSRAQMPTSRRVQQALDGMTDAQRLVFVLYEFERLPGSQIATIANCSEATVWSELQQARRMFCDHFGLIEPDAVGSV